MTNEPVDCIMHDSNLKSVKVKCDWQSNVSGMEIEDCVVVRPIQSETDADKLDVFQLITELNCKCVNFEKPEHQGDLFINVSCDTMHVINTIAICSEARIIELFGGTGDYVSVHRSSLVNNDFDEFQMYSHLIPVDSTVCSLKFKQFNNSDFIWIFGIIIHVAEVKEHPNKFLGPINMQNVQNLLEPKSLDSNASKLFSTLSMKQSEPNSNAILNSILNDFKNFKFPSNNPEGNQLMSISFKQFEKKVEDKLNSMTVQMNTIENNIETLNKKFDLLLNAIHDRNIML